jgi:hypothetical protein
VSTFDGTQENYDESEMKWNAFAQVEQFIDALAPNGHPNMPADHKTGIPYEGQGEGKKQARTKKGNAKNAVAYNTLDFKSGRLRGMINDAKTNERPGGEA